MRLVFVGFLIGTLAATAQGAAAQSAGQSQSSQFPPVFVPMPPGPVTIPPYPKKWPAPAKPRGNPGLWVTTNDYPISSLLGGEEGVTGFRVTIDRFGRVIGCEIVDTSGYPLLDAETCSSVFRRARFSPAINDREESVIGTWSSKVRWTIPEDKSSFHPTPRVSVESYIIGTDGSATSCQRLENGEDATATWETYPCGYGAQFSVYVDTDGKPVPKKVTMTTTVTVTDPEAKP